MFAKLGAEYLVAAVQQRIEKAAYHKLRTLFCAFCVLRICAYLDVAAVGAPPMEVGMIDPKANMSVLLTLQEVATSAAEAAEAQRQRFSYLFSNWIAPRDSRVRVTLVALEDRRMAARRKILAELSQMDRFH
jgi:hypothetical protein